MRIRSNDRAVIGREAAWIATGYLALELVAVLIILPLCDVLSLPPVLVAQLVPLGIASVLVIPRLSRDVQFEAQEQQSVQDFQLLQSAAQLVKSHSDSAKTPTAKAQLEKLYDVIRSCPAKPSAAASASENEISQCLLSLQPDSETLQGDIEYIRALIRQRNDALSIRL